MINGLDTRDYLLQAVCNNSCTAVNWACQCISRNDNNTITHKKQRTAAKELSMDSFKSQCKLTSLLSQPSLVYLYRVQPQWEQILLVSIPIYCYQKCYKTLSGLLVGQWKWKYVHPMHFYTNVCFLISLMTFYDVNHNLLKAAIEAKSSRISPNHTCQNSLLTLSYNISPCHFFTAKDIVGLHLVLTFTTNLVGCFIS